MKFNSIITLLIPPLFIELYRKARYGNHAIKQSLNTKQYIWAGIYKNFSEVPIKNNQSKAKGFEDFNKNIYIDSLIEEAKVFIDVAKKNKIIPKDIIHSDLLLPLAASLTIKKTRNIKYLIVEEG